MNYHQQHRSSAAVDDDDDSTFSGLLTQPMNATSTVATGQKNSGLLDEYRKKRKRKLEGPPSVIAIVPEQDGSEEPDRRKKSADNESEELDQRKLASNKRPYIDIEETEAFKTAYFSDFDCSSDEETEHSRKKTSRKPTSRNKYVDPETTQAYKDATLTDSEETNGDTFNDTHPDNIMFSWPNNGPTIEIESAATRPAFAFSALPKRRRKSKKSAVPQKKTKKNRSAPPLGRHSAQDKSMAPPPRRHSRSASAAAKNPRTPIVSASAAAAATAKVKSSPRTSRRSSPAAAPSQRQRQVVQNMPPPPPTRNDYDYKRGGVKKSAARKAAERAALRQAAARKSNPDLRHSASRDDSVPTALRHSTSENDSAPTAPETIELVEGPSAERPRVLPRQKDRQRVQRPSSAPPVAAAPVAAVTSPAPVVTYNSCNFYGSSNNHAAPGIPQQQMLQNNMALMGNQLAAAIGAMSHGNVLQQNQRQALPFFAVDAQGNQFNCFANTNPVMDAAACGMMMMMSGMLGGNMGGMMNPMMNQFPASVGAMMGDTMQVVGLQQQRLQAHAQRLLVEIMQFGTDATLKTGISERDIKRLSYHALAYVVNGWRKEDLDNYDPSSSIEAHKLKRFGLFGPSGLTEDAQGLQLFLQAAVFMKLSEGESREAIHHGDAFNFKESIKLFAKEQDFGAYFTEFASKMGVEKWLND